MSTWTTQLTTLEQRAAEHDKFSAQLISNLAEPLKVLANRYEELRKLHTDYNAKLVQERDGSYADLRKMKGKYDSVCQEVENRRKKIDGAFDHGKGKAQVAYQQQMSDMHNVKVGNRPYCIFKTNLDLQEYVYNKYQRDQPAKRTLLSQLRPGTPRQHARPERNPRNIPE